PEIVPEEPGKNNQNVVIIDALENYNNELFYKTRLLKTPKTSPET
ncbi:4495_t:CDS:1, partial [Gigaspora margarita]